MATLINETTMSQCNAIIKHMETIGAIDAKTAFLDYGVLRLASRIHDIKKKVPIEKTMQTGTNRYGKTVRYAVYRLKKQAA